MLITEKMTAEIGSHLIAYLFASGLPLSLLLG